MAAIGLAQDAPEKEKAALAPDAFWAPPVPPRAHYTIDCDIDPTNGTLHGSETIRLKNTSSKPIGRLALSRSGAGDATVRVALPPESAGPPAADPTDLETPMLLQLAEPLAPGRELELEMSFQRTIPKAQADPYKLTLTDWHPRLWWGFPTHDDFEVTVRVPPGYVVGSTGRLDKDTGRYQEAGVRSLGLFVGRGLQAIEADAGGVAVRCLFTPDGEECARLLLETAADVIAFYRDRFGLYPHTSLTIVPGMDRPAGGYPISTGLVAIHGQERMSERPEIHWRWITAHEIGHQYWGEQVMERDSPGWLWIGLGIYADREYIRARGLSLEKHRELMGRYIDGVRKGLDTTVERPPEQVDSVDFDFNNVVIHGKGYSIVSALACLLGQEAFDRVYQRCLTEFAGRRLGAREFQAVAEEETGEDLGWFFDQWLRSSAYLSYEITSQETKAQDGRHTSKVEVECLGTLKMPVPVVVKLGDGTEQRRFTDRLPVRNVLEFTSDAPLAEAQLDPSGELALVVPPPPPNQAEIARRVQRLPWTGAGEQAVEVFTAAQEVEVQDADLWGKLGLTLYDGRHYSEALTAFGRAAEFSGEGPAWAFASVVWQGHVLDLLDRRDEAVARYQEALEKADGAAMQHGQYGMTIDRAWVEQRLKTPFTRE